MGEIQRDKIDRLFDDMFGYYMCECGHYAVDHFMDAPPKYQACGKCDCKRFESRRPD